MASPAPQPSQQPTQRPAPGAIPVQKKELSTGVAVAGGILVLLGLAWMIFKMVTAEPERTPTKGRKPAIKPATKG
jgi:hypothetical protein